MTLNQKKENKEKTMKMKKEKKEMETLQCWMKMTMTTADLGLVTEHIYRKSKWMLQDLNRKMLEY